MGSETNQRAILMDILLQPAYSHYYQHWIFQNLNFFWKQGRKARLARLQNHCVQMSYTGECTRCTNCTSATTQVNKRKLWKASQKVYGPTLLVKYPYQCGSVDCQLEMLNFNFTCVLNCTVLITS